ncbi:MAG: hypothetical protein QNK03_21160 [Myxococcota bacterium]|nr:hypothetical protein [Myxococcota bacterium]
MDRYSQQGPPAFMPGHAGVLQMTGVLLREGAPADARVLVVGAGGGLGTRALAMAHPAFRFVEVDPAPQMIELARNASLLVESGFHDCEAFYVGMAWRGWLASA